MLNGKQVYIHTWGCQMNEHKSEGIAGTLLRAGYGIVRRPEEADVIIFNTCTVRGKAVDKVFGKLGQVKQIREEQDKRIILGLGGCLAQAEQESIFSRSDQVDFLFGTSDQDIKGIPELIKQAQVKQYVTGIGEPVGLDSLPFSRKNDFQAYVTITEGCNHFCSFCIVPYTRGRLRSRPFAEIVQEVEQLADAGYKEVTLLGQNVNAYLDCAKRSPNDGGFAALLRSLSRTSIARIRFTSSHPRDMTTEVLEAIAEGANICEHVHMAAQSGSNRILKEMRRGYTKEEFLGKVEEARERIPGVNTTTDLIVGYPGETKAEFEETVNLLKKARFGRAFIFKYSPRKGTISSLKYEDSIPDEEKQRRLLHLLKLQREISEEENKRRIGEKVNILVEELKTSEGASYNLIGKSRDDKTVICGAVGCTSRHFVQLNVRSTLKRMIGELLNVRVVDATAGSLLGDAIGCTSPNLKPTEDRLDNHSYP